jgi:endonuclease YncB( thermonuclease family)
MNGWYRAALTIGLTVAITSCSAAVANPQEQGQVTDPAPEIASLNLPTATVVSVGDGDTLRMDYQGQNVTVRLACINAQLIMA